MGNPNRRGQAPVLPVRLHNKSKPSNSEIQSPSRLLSLPAELRNKIYEYVFISTVGTPISRASGYPESTHWPQDSDHALVMVNRQIHDETIAMYYDSFQTPPVFWSYEAAKSFYGSLNSVHRARTSSLEFMTLPYADIHSITIGLPETDPDAATEEWEKAYEAWAREADKRPNRPGYTFSDLLDRQRIRVSRLEGLGWVVEASKEW